MHELEPFFNWRDLYVASEDEASPFYGKDYSEFMLSNAVYDHYIHPQWDEIGSATLYLKVLFVSYDREYAIIELIGEWNDILYNDIMYLYRNLIEDLIGYDIKHFIIIGENLMNFHADSTDYYEEWFDNIGDGWIVGLNFRDHVVEEFCSANIDYYIAFKGEFDDFNWRAFMPDELFDKINAVMSKRLGM